ncbi:addiction module antidote protein [Pseudomonas sp. Marseille-Q5115]|uniref:addiction module antidote protein n=1 Tax=Pseudomonas sp. Marseille-Q5115 TaxID=2866593 RepID=UPI001CE497D6|nr:addiction module antidote protein [Pseudomonas sp. Marseille-Q5115]
MKEELHSYDPAEGLTDLESIEVFLVDAFESGDADYITKALAIVCSAKGRSEIASETGLPLTLLGESLEKGNPTLRTLLDVTRALGLDLTIRPQRLQEAGSA